MQIVSVDPQTDLLWQQLVDQNGSSAFHSPAWIRVLADTYGWKPHALVLVDGTGVPRAAIPFCRITDIMGSRIVTLPFSDYCDPLVTDREQWNALIERLSAEGFPVVVRCLHNPVPTSDERFILYKQAHWHGLDLQPDLDTLWHQLPDSSRRAIGKAQRDGIVVRIAEHEDVLRAFFGLHLKTRKYKYRLVAQPYRFFENIWRHFIEAKRGRLLVAVCQEEIIAGVLFLEWKNTLYYKFNASLPSFLGHRPNDLLIWEGIRYGKAAGYGYLDFGLSDWDQEGLVRFKRKFATDEKVISFLRYAQNQVPTQQEQQVRALLTGLTSLFTDESVPDHVTEQAGELVYRFFT